MVVRKTGKHFLKSFTQILRQLKLKDSKMFHCRMITAAFSKKQLPIIMNEVEQDTKSFGNMRMIAQPFSICKLRTQ